MYAYHFAYNFARSIIAFMRGFMELISTNKKYIKWVEFNNNNFEKLENQTSKFVINDVFMVPEWQFVNSFAIHELCKFKQCGAATFGSLPRKFSERQMLESYGSNKHFIVQLRSLKLIKRHRELFARAVKEIDSKQNLFDFTVDGVHIGIDIYESILRTGLPTVTIDSFVTWHNVFIGLEYFVYFDDLFKRDKVEAMVLSHENYIYMGIPSKLGFKYQVPSYFFNPREFLKITKAYKLNERFSRFPSFFNRLTEEEKVNAKAWSKEVLNRRLKGEVGAEIAYQLESAFTFDKVPSQVIRNGKKNVIIATHEFYDNPHGLGGLLFYDFYEWLIYLGEKSKEGKYNWYVKPHRDVAASEVFQLNKICELYPSLILLNKDYTFHQLKEEGVDIALTCYGTIGHELPFLGYTVINAGNNPHMAYHFNIHPKNLQEYHEILSDLDSIKLEFDEEEIFEFFYTYKKIIYAYDFKIENYLPGNYQKTNDIYLDFLLGAQAFKIEITEELKAFIYSNSTYSFLLK